MKVSAALIVPFLLACGVSESTGQTEKNLLRNGDFERFTGNDPTGWETTNIPNACVVVSPSSQAHDGKSAVRLEVKDCFGSKIPGMVSQKNIKLPPGSYRLTFQYLMKSAGQDVGYISLDFKNSEGSTIRMCEQRLLDSKGVYVGFSGDFPAPEGSVTGELKVALLSAKDGGSLHLGSFILLDAMVMRSAKE